MGVCGWVVGWGGGGDVIYPFKTLVVLKVLLSNN